MVKGHNLLPLGDTLAMTRCTHWLAQVMERLFHDLGSVLRLAAVTLQALLGFAVAAPSSFGVFFGDSCGCGHRVLRCAV